MSDLFTVEDILIEILEDGAGWSWRASCGCWEHWPDLDASGTAATYDAAHTAALDAAQRAYQDMYDEATREHARRMAKIQSAREAK